MGDQAAVIERLQKRVDELESQLRQALGEVARFRRRGELKRPEGEKKSPGRPKGHKAEYRPVPEAVDRQEAVPLEGCPHCGGTVGHVRECVQYIEEIPPSKPVTVKVTTYCGVCEACGPVRSQHPWQTSTATGAAGTQLGPRAQAIAVSLIHRTGLTIRRACRVLRDLWGLALSPGGLTQLLERVSQRMNDWHEQVLEAIRTSAAVHVDETGWYVGTSGWWLWVFTTPTNTLYVIDRSRGSEVVRRTLGDQFDGMLVSDCLGSYDSLDYRQHKCISHHLKALKEHEQAVISRGEKPGDLLLWKLHLQDVIETWKRRTEMTEDQFASKVAQLRRGVENLLNRAPPSNEEARFRNRLAKQKDRLLGCLEEPAAEPTNNRAERDLRPAVISRKLSCGNKTETGKTAWETLRSLVTTAIKQGRDPLAEIAQRLTLKTAP